MMTDAARKFDGTYINVTNGMAHVFEALGWEKLEHVYAGTHHGYYGAMMYWPGEGEPAYPADWKQIRLTEEKTAAVAVITGDHVDERYITLGVGDGTFQRWKLTEELLKKLRREINAKLD